MSKFTICDFGLVICFFIVKINHNNTKTFFYLPYFGDASIISLLLFSYCTDAMLASLLLFSYCTDAMLASLLSLTPKS